MQVIPHTLYVEPKGKLLVVVQDALDQGKVHQIRVEAEDYVKWTKHGVLIQDAFPYLNADQREILMTGLGPASWDKVMGKDD